MRLTKNLFIFLSFSFLIISCSSKKRLITNENSHENLIELSDEISQVENTDDSSLSIIEEEKEEIGFYTIKPKETLMLISFKIYGDYLNWKSIKQLNPKSQFKAGDQIRYFVPKKEFTWSPLGEPYLIRYKDTLQTISQKLYDTTRKWPELYENNRPLIKDPNKIFVGFTIFYIPEEKHLAKQEIISSGTKNRKL